nr:hypothetical protein [Armatimonadota bacterium]
MRRAWGPSIAWLCAIPPVVIAIWAGAYLRGYLAAIDDTFYGLTFTYRAAKGPVVGRADTLRFNWRTGRVIAEGVTLSQVGAPAVARMADVDLTVPLPWTLNEAYLITASDGFAEVVRYRDGRWSFEDFAPFQEAEPSEAVPIEVQASDVRIRFHDRYVKTPTTWNLAADDLVVGVLGSDASTSFRGTVDGVGVVSTEFDLLDGALRFFNVSGKNLHILPLKNYFGQWEGLRGTQAFTWTADSAEFSGKVTARPSASGDWLVRGEGEALAANLLIDGRRFETVRFDGGFTEKGAGGRIIGAGRGLDVDGVGYLAFGETITGRIEGTASAGSAAAIESLLAGVLPGNLDFTGANFDGVFTLVGDAIAVSGKLTADSVRYEEYRATNVIAGIASDGKVVRILDGRGHTFGTNVRADLAISVGESPVIDGVVRADNVLLSQVPGIPDDFIQGGRANIQALISGPVSNPTASLHASGNTTVIIEFEDQSVPSDVRFDVTGDYRKGVFEVQAAEVGGDLGALQGKGSIGIESGALDLDLFASGIDLSALPGTSLTGLAYGDLHVDGTTDSPKVNGFVEVYGASLDEYTLPFASSEIAYANKQLTATDIVARRGVSVIEGDATLDLRSASWPVTGKGRVLDLMLGEFTGDTLTGIANGAWELDGSFYDPNVDVELASPSVLADRIEIRDVAAKARWAKGALSIGDFSAMISGGKLTGQGGWSRTGPSSLKAHLESASTWALRPYLEGVARLGGRISGDAEVSFLDGKILRGNVEVTGTELQINREPIGGATIIAEADSKQILFRGGLGDLDSNYVIDNGVFNFDAKTVSADFYALGGNIETIMRVVSSLAENASVEQLQLMRQIDGVLTLDGRIEAAQVDNKWKLTGGRADVGVGGLTVQGEAAGDVTFRTNKQGDRFVIETAEWSGPQAALRLNPGENYIDENGQISISGDIYNIDLNWFKSVRPEMANVDGKADISFVARAPIEKPEI